MPFGFPCDQIDLLNKFKRHLILPVVGLCFFCSAARAVESDVYTALLQYAARDTQAAPEAVQGLEDGAEPLDARMPPNFDLSGSLTIGANAYLQTPYPLDAVLAIVRWDSGGVATLPFHPETRAVPRTDGRLPQLFSKVYSAEIPESWPEGSARIFFAFRRGGRWILSAAEPRSVDVKRWTEVNLNWSNFYEQATQETSNLGTPSTIPIPARSVVIRGWGIRPGQRYDVAIYTRAGETRVQSVTAEYDGALVLPADPESGAVREARVALRTRRGTGPWRASIILGMDTIEGADDLSPEATAARNWLESVQSSGGLKSLDPAALPESPWGGRWQYVNVLNSRFEELLAFDRAGALRARYYSGDINPGWTFYDAFANDTPIGRAKENFLWTPPWENHALGNLVTEALRKIAGADVGFVNALGLRGNLPAGPITETHIRHALPFDNSVYKIKVQAHVLRTVLLLSVQSRFHVHVSGVQLRYWPDPFGKPEDGELYRMDGTPIDRTDILTLSIGAYDAENSPLAAVLEEMESAQGGESVQPIPVISTMRSALTDYIRKHGVVAPDTRPRQDAWSEEEVKQEIQKKLTGALAAMRKKKISHVPETPCEHVDVDGDLWIPNVWTAGGVRAVPDGTNFWVAVQGGLALVNDSIPLEFFHLPGPRDKSRFGPQIRGILPTSRGLAVVTADGKMNFFDLSKRQWTRAEQLVENDAWDDDGHSGWKHDRRGTPHDRRGFAMVEDPFDTLLWIYSDGDLRTYDPATGGSSNLNSVFEKFDLGDPNVGFILCAKNDVWVTVPSDRQTAGGLLRYHRPSEKWKLYQKELAGSTPDAVATLMVWDTRVVTYARAGGQGYLAELDMEKEVWTRWAGKEAMGRFHALTETWPAGLLAIRGAPRKRSRLQQNAADTFALLNACPAPGAWFTVQHQIWRQTPGGDFEIAGGISNPRRYEHVIAADRDNLMVRTNQGLKILDPSKFKLRSVPDPDSALLNGGWMTAPLDGGTLFWQEGQEKDGWEDFAGRTPPRCVLWDWQTLRLQKIPYLIGLDPTRYLEKFYSGSDPDETPALSDGRRVSIRYDGIWIERY